MLVKFNYVYTPVPNKNAAQENDLLPLKNKRPTENRHQMLSTSSFKSVIIKETRMCIKILQSNTHKY